MAADLSRRLVGGAGERAFVAAMRRHDLSARSAGAGAPAEHIDKFRPARSLRSAGVSVVRHSGDSWSSLVCCLSKRSRMAAGWLP